MPLFFLPSGTLHETIFFTAVLSFILCFNISCILNLLIPKYRHLPPVLLTLRSIRKKEKHLNLLKRQTLQLTLDYKKNRKEAHDIKNRITTLSFLIANKNWNTAEQYLDFIISEKDYNKND